NGGRLQHELAGLGYEYEVALHLRMSHGDRPALLDLRGEGGDDRPPRAEDIAEANADIGAGGSVGEGRGQALRDAPAGPQDATGVRGVVRGDVDEGADPDALRGLQHVEAAQHIGLPGFFRVALE